MWPKSRYGIYGPIKSLFLLEKLKKIWIKIHWRDVSFIGFSVGQILYYLLFYVVFWDSIPVPEFNCSIIARNIFFINFYVFLLLWLQSITWREVFLSSKIHAVLSINNLWFLYRYLGWFSLLWNGAYSCGQVRLEIGSLAGTACYFDPVYHEMAKVVWLS